VYLSTSDIDIIDIVGSITLRLLVYRRDTWSLSLRAGHSSGLLGNSVLRKTFGPEKEKVVRGWSRLHDEKLHDL
jgi:hypothetical protein